MWPRSNSLKAIWGERSRKRQEARETAFNLDEFGEIDIEKYDLDTAGITGEDNDRTYQWDRPLMEEANGTDIRELDRH